MKKRISAILIYFFAKTASAQILVGLDEIDNFTQMLIAMSGGLAILMIGFHALNCVTSETSDERKEAKDGIINVFIGLIIIILTFILVDLLYTAPDF